MLDSQSSSLENRSTPSAHNPPNRQADASSQPGPKGITCKPQSGSMRNHGSLEDGGALEERPEAVINGNNDNSSINNNNNMNHGNGSNYVQSNMANPSSPTNHLKPMLRQHSTSRSSAREEEIVLDDELLATAGREEASEYEAAEREAPEYRDIPWFYETLSTLALIAVGSIAGVALRVALSLTSVDPFSDYIFANFVGTAWLAYWSYFKHVLWTPLFVGVGTGFCGSLTSFSSWQEAGAVLVGPTVLGIDRREKAFVWFEVQLAGIAVDLIAYDFGRHIGKTHPFKPPKNEPDTIVCAPRVLYHAGSITFAVLIGLLVALLAGYFHTELLFALCWGPFGAWSRYFLGRLFNSKLEGFPLGTFIANVFASALLAMAYVLGISVSRADTVQCEALQGFITGYCGSLSTVSTFIAELKGLGRKDAYVYGFASMIVAQICMIIIIGGYTWSAADLTDFENGDSCVSVYYP